jgi:superfamily II DNA/RNA helicase
MCSLCYWPKLQETLRLVKAHREGRISDGMRGLGASDISPEASRSVVVSSCFLRCLYLLEKLLGEVGISCGILEGKLSVDQRKAVLQDFEEGRIQVCDMEVVGRVME